MNVPVNFVSRKRPPRIMLRVSEPVVFVGSGPPAHDVILASQLPSSFLSTACIGPGVANFIISAIMASCDVPGAVLVAVGAAVVLVVVVVVVVVALVVDLAVLFGVVPARTAAGISAATATRHVSLRRSKCMGRSPPWKRTWSVG